MTDKPISPGDLVFVDNDYLSLIYSDAFTHKHSVESRPFLVLGKHQNSRGIYILAPVSSQFYYNYAKLERRTRLRLEEPNAPSVVLISNNAVSSKTFFNGAVLLDQSIACPSSLLELHKQAFKDYVIGAPQKPVKPLLATSDPFYKNVMRKYDAAISSWEKCSNHSLFLPKVNINWFIQNGKNVVKRLSYRGKMDFDIIRTLGVAYVYSNKGLRDF